MGPDQSDDELGRNTFHPNLSCEGHFQRLTGFIYQWITYSSISLVSAEFYNVSQNSINAFSIAYMASLCACCP